MKKIRETKVGWESQIQRSTQPGGLPIWSWILCKKPPAWSLIWRHFAHISAPCFVPWGLCLCSISSNTIFFEFESSWKSALQVQYSSEKSMISQTLWQKQKKMKFSPCTFRENERLLLLWLARSFGNIGLYVLLKSADILVAIGCWQMSDCVLLCIWLFPPDFCFEEFFDFGENGVR